MRYYSFHQPISPLSTSPRSFPTNQFKQQLRWIRRNASLILGDHALLSDFGQNLLRTVNLFSAPDDLEQ